MATGLSLEENSLHLIFPICRNDYPTPNDYRSKYQKAHVSSQSSRNYMINYYYMQKLKMRTRKIKAVNTICKGKAKNKTPMKA